MRPVRRVGRWAKHEALRGRLFDLLEPHLDSARVEYTGHHGRLAGIDTSFRAHGLASAVDELETMLIARRRMELASRSAVLLHKRQHITMLTDITW